MTNSMDMITTVDTVIMTIEGDTLKVLLHCRPSEPFKGDLALPGGFVDPARDADTRGAAKRILRDKVGISNIYLEQLATYSGPDRDPRGWSLSVTYLALVPRDMLDVREGQGVSLVEIDHLPALAFDHAVIISDAMARLRGKGAYSTLPASFLPRDFTFSQLRRAYEIVLGEKLDKVSFRRKITDLDMIEETGQTSKEDSRRPAMLYRMAGHARTFNRTLAMSG